MGEGGGTGAHKLEHRLAPRSPTLKAPLALGPAQVNPIVLL